MWLDPDFRPLLRGYDLAAMERDKSTIFGMWADTTISYVNPAYVDFAQGSDAEEVQAHWMLGRRVMDSVGEPLRPFYEELFARALSTQKPVVHRYQCHTPELAREYAMHLYPLPDAETHARSSMPAEGLLCVNSLVLSRAHAERHAPSESLYRDANGLVLQCAHCRRVRRVTEASQWDFVPVYVARSPSGTSHGLCPVCVAYHYPARKNASPT